MSIMPLLMTAPMNTPMAAMVMITRKEAALAPMAELRKFTASLLTPTERSKIANRKRKMMIPRNTMSIRSFVFYNYSANERKRCYKTIAVG